MGVGRQIVIGEVVGTVSVSEMLAIGVLEVARWLNVSSLPERHRGTQRDWLRTLSPPFKSPNLGDVGLQ